MAYSLAHFGAGSGVIFLDQVGCTGNEAKLGDCPSNPTGAHDCSILEDAGVGCYGLLVEIATLCNEPQISSCYKFML